ncbi:MAG TPA: HAD family hydrolase [Polyangiaceae bacterium]
MPFRSSRSPASGTPVLASDEVIALLDEGLSPNAMLAFDADGTLWSGDIGVETFESVLDKRALRRDALEALQAEARLYRVPLHDDPNDQARQLHDAYQHGAYPEERAFPMMAWAFAGFRTNEMRAFGREVVQDGALATRVHPEVLPILRWAAKRALPVYVVSASQAGVVRVAVELLQLPITDVFAMSPDVEDGVLQPRLIEPVTYGAGKTAALRASVPDKILLGAFGDSPFDAAMLREAKVAVCVRPKPDFLTGARCPGLIELLPRDS